MINSLGRCLLGIVLAIGVQVLYPEAVSADSVRDAQWHLSFLNIGEAQVISRGSGVGVAVVDTGVDASHPDLGDSVVGGSEVNGSGDGRSDLDGHGTSMAGLVAARGRGASTGVLGIAPSSFIIPIKIPDQQSPFVAAGIDRARAQGAKVICLALSTGDDHRLDMAVERAQAADIVVVAAAGNRPDVGIQIPARTPGVVAVVGVDHSGNHAAISVSGPEALIAAPAIDIVSTAPSGAYSKGTGTSDASAIVAGVAALIRSKFPDLNATEVIHRMTATAIDKGNPGRDKEYGFGIVDPVAALTADVPPNRASLSGAPGPTNAAESSPPSNNATGPVIGFAVLVAGLVVLVGGVVFLGWRSNRRIKTNN